MNNGVLQIIGTNRDDHVEVKIECSRQMVVAASFLDDLGHKRIVNPAGIQRIEMFLYGGDNNAWIDYSILLPAFIDGDSGDDHLRSGGGPTVLLNGSGDDHLDGGKGRSILIGGTVPAGIRAGT